jgi:flagellar biosynthesis chaperone FliJ
MQKPVSPSEFQAAQHALAKITPALSSLKHLDKQALGHDESAWAEIQEFIALLDQIQAKNQSVIEHGNAQYTNRPQDLINQATRRLNEIPTLIRREESALKHKLNAREFEAEELRKKNFSADKIDQLVPPIPQSEIDASNAAVTGLKAEAEAIQTFLADAPRFDVELLCGTTLYPDNDSITEAAA